MIKVLLVSPQMKKPIGGIAVWTDGYLKKSTLHGIDCTLVNSAPIGVRAENGNSGRNLKDEWVRTKRIFKDLKKELVQRQFDATHINSSCGAFGIIRDYYTTKKIRKKQPNARVVAHFRCDIPFQIRNGISKRFLGKLVKIADKCLVLCDTSREYLLKEFGVNSQKVPNFLDEDCIIGGQKDVREDLKTVFFVGRVSLAKGASELYELARRFPDVRFLLAGVADKTVAEWEMPKNMELLGLVEHKRILELMDESDIFLFPTHSEGFSIALTEAMARGLPTVTTNVGANADMIETGGGVVVSVGDVDAMEKAIEMMRSKAVREQMSAWSLDKAKRTYTSDSVLALLHEIYTEK